MFYVYEWYVKETGEIFYVGKGCGNRYKSTTKRNKMFLLYIDRFDCESRIIGEYESEDDAFYYEHNRIMELKSVGQAKCNLDYGGKGGCHFSWTDEMREYKSQYNPMKLAEQRERMSKNNPMKNKAVAEKVGAKKSKAVVINGTSYKSVRQASEMTGHCEYTIIKWCKRGYDCGGNPCRYAGEEQKEIPLVKQLHPMSATPKPVFVDDIRFETVEDGAKYIGGNSSNLIRAIKANRPYRGHICRYVNQQPSQTNTDNSSLEGSTTNG